MDEAKRKAFEAAGFQVGDYGDFLDLTDGERQLVELRSKIGRAIREARAARGLNQRELAALLKTSQPRIAKIEAAAPDVSLDLMLRGFFTIGGRLSPHFEPNIGLAGKRPKTRAAKVSAPAKRPRKATGSRS